ncbi:MAG: hypothetical protein KC503_19425 [Myxococcales bacterium]|nr:hypothetical protein [Myxococcales bacterium]
MPLRTDEKPVADALIAALRTGDVHGLAAMPEARYDEGDDPPDLLVTLNTESVVGVELATMISVDLHDEDGVLIAPGFGRQTHEAVREYDRQRTLGIEFPRVVDAWSPTPLEDVCRVLEAKAEKYRAKGAAIDWLLVHPSLVARPGYVELGVTGIREIRERIERQHANAAAYFDRVIVCGEARRQLHFGVVAARDGRMIATRQCAVVAALRERFGADLRAQASDVVATEGNFYGRIPEVGNGVVLALRWTDAGGLQLKRAAASNGAPRPALERLFGEVGPPWGAFVPTTDAAAAETLAAELLLNLPG